MTWVELIHRILFFLILKLLLWVIFHEHHDFWFSHSLIIQKPFKSKKNILRRYKKTWYRELSNWKFLALPLLVFTCGLTIEQFKIRIIFLQFHTPYCTFKFYYNFLRKLILMMQMSFIKMSNIVLCLHDVKCVHHGFKFLANFLINLL